MDARTGLSIEVVVGLAVGIPGLLVAALTLWINYLTLRRYTRHRHRDSNAVPLHPISRWPVAVNSTYTPVIGPRPART